MILWRISNYATLEGKGGLIDSARWHSRGRLIVYLTEHPALALLEILANTETQDLPNNLQLLCVKAPRVKAMSPNLPDFWKRDIALTREIGDEWLASQQSPLFKVPSVLMPRSWNYLLNPRHKHAKLIEIKSAEPFVLDTRLK